MFVGGSAFETYSKALPIKRAFENDLIVAFYHPKPFQEKHVLIVPKKIKNIVSLTPEDMIYINEVFKVVKDIVAKLKLKEYALLINGGDRQEVNRMHFHLCTGKEVN